MQSKIDMMFKPKKNCMETNVPHQERQDPGDLFVFCFYDVLLRRAAEAQMQTQLSMVMRQSQPKRKDLQCGRQDQQVPMHKESHAKTNEQVRGKAKSHGGGRQKYCKSSHNFTLL